MNGPVVFFIVFIFFLYFPLNWQVFTTMSLCFTEEDRKPVRVCLLTLVLKLWLKRVKPNYTRYNIVIDTLTTSTYVWRVWFVCVCVCVWLTGALLQWGAGAHVDVVYPDMSPGAVCKETLHHNLPKTRRGRGGRGGGGRWAKGGYI